MEAGIVAMTRCAAEFARSRAENLRAGAESVLHKLALCRGRLRLLRHFHTRGL